MPSFEATRALIREALGASLFGANPATPPPRFGVQLSTIRLGPLAYRGGLRRLRLGGGGGLRLRRRLRSGHFGLEGADIALHHDGLLVPRPVIHPQALRTATQSAKQASRRQQECCKLMLEYAALFEYERQHQWKESSVTKRFASAACHCSLALAICCLSNCVFILKRCRKY